MKKNPVKSLINSSRRRSRKASKRKRKSKALKCGSRTHSACKRSKLCKLVKKKSKKTKKKTKRCLTKKTAPRIRAHLRSVRRKSSRAKSRR